LKKVDGLTEYQGMIKGLDLCEDCVKEYHVLAGEGLMPVTLLEDRDVELSECVWTSLMPAADIMAAHMEEYVPDFVKASDMITPPSESDADDPALSVCPSFYELNKDDQRIIVAEQRRHVNRPIADHELVCRETNTVVASGTFGEMAHAMFGANKKVGSKTAYFFREVERR